MKKLYFPILFAVFISGCEKPKFQSQDILVTGTAEPLISLNGNWKFTMKPPENFFLDEVSPADWNDITVPGECIMQGYPLNQNTPYVFKREVNIPSDYKGKLIKIRFEGVYNYARVWVNGKFIRGHKGGYSPWECDITAIAEPGKIAWITVELTDKGNYISEEGGFAGYPIGGILRNVTLLALPVEIPESVYVTTNFDQRYKNASLNIRVIKTPGEKTWVGFKMYDRKGAQVRLTDRRYRLTSDTSDFSFRVTDPVKWSAEDPALYTLVIEIFNESILTASLMTKFGFRDVKVNGNKLLVNGQEVKLRGANRHDIHPALGRISTPEYDLKDVLLAKEANMNFIRSSYFPLSETFLRYCDEYGLYVEEVTALFSADSLSNNILKDVEQSGVEHLKQQMSQLTAMVMNHYNHPSVITWSVSNNNLSSTGSKTVYDHIKSIDPTRPLVACNPGTVADSVIFCDIIALQYPSFNGDSHRKSLNADTISFPGKPVILVNCDHETALEDTEFPGDKDIRNFRENELDSMWTLVFGSDRYAGCAVFRMIDKTFMLPDTIANLYKVSKKQEPASDAERITGQATGYGELGIVDVFREKKPAFWNTKKAYSPILILADEIGSFKAGTPLEIPVYNRFDHTNLRDVITEWTYRDKKSVDRIWTIGPHRRGTIQLRASDWTAGEKVKIRFLTRDSLLIDEYNIRLGK